MKYSLCLTNYNRYEMLIESFAKVLDDERIEEVIISDDHSDELIFRKLSDYFKNNSKVELAWHDENVGMLENKKRAISYAKNDWCILFDSDNILDKDYLDAIDAHIEESGELNDMTVYMPSFAKTNFNFSNFSGCTFDLKNIGQLINDSMGNVSMNCCNYLLNKNHFKVEENPHVKSVDTLWINYRLLMHGFSFHIVPNLEYIHTVHPDSGYLKDIDYNQVMGAQIKQLILRESQQANNK